MADARTKLEWSQTSSLMALIYNANPYLKSGRAKSPSYFDPTHKDNVASRQGGDDEVGNVDDLRRAFAAAFPKKVKRKPGPETKLQGGQP